MKKPNRRHGSSGARLSHPVRGRRSPVRGETSDQAPCGDTSTIQLAYGTSSLAICQSAAGSTTNDTVGDWETSGDRTTITWHIAPIFKPGVKISKIYASTSVFVLGVFDEATSQGVFTYGQ